MKSVSLRAFCKINLCLEVLGRREDGYHELATIFQAISLADVVTVETRDESVIELAVPGGGAPEDRSNLCWMAAETYREHRGWPTGVSMTLRKAVPSGAGLGGGSSDAAAVLMGLAQIDDRPPRWEELSQLAKDLGADVPFFLMSGAALGVGRGDDLTSLPEMPSCRIVLTRPDLTISTAGAYSMLSEDDFTDGSRTRKMAEALERGALLREIAPHVYNGFSRALTHRWPLLAELSARLSSAGASAAQITGSGSAVFGLFDDEDEARSMAKQLSDEGLWVRIAEPAPCGAAIIE